MDKKEESKEKLPDDESVKPLIEVISENPAIFKDSEQIMEQKEIKEKLHTSQSVFDYRQKDVSM